MSGPNASRRNGLSWVGAPWPDENPWHRAALAPWHPVHLCRGFEASPFGAATPQMAFLTGAEITPALRVRPLGAADRAYYLRTALLVRAAARHLCSSVGTHVPLAWRHGTTAMLVLSHAIVSAPDSYEVCSLHSTGDGRFVQWQLPVLPNGQPPEHCDMYVGWVDVRSMAPKALQVVAVAPDRVRVDGYQCWVSPDALAIAWPTVSADRLWGNPGGRLMAIAEHIATHQYPEVRRDLVIQPMVRPSGAPAVVGVLRRPGSHAEDPLLLVRSLDEGRLIYCSFKHAGPGNEPFVLSWELAPLWYLGMRHQADGRGWIPQTGLPFVGQSG